jgi:hypothetical protein
MVKDDAASKRPAKKIARRARADDANLRRAFDNLVSDLNDAYGQPARDAADTGTVVLSAAEETQLSQHVLAQLAVARFLDRMGPVGDLAHFADQFANLAQALDDRDSGIRAPIFDLAPAKKRSDRTKIWLARACVAVAVEIMRQCGHSKSRESAAEWVAKKYPGLEQLITETGPRRSETTLEKAIIHWCENFSSHKIRKIRNKVAAGVYDKLKTDKLKTRGSNCNSDQMEGEADRLLQKAVAFADLKRR